MPEEFNVHAVRAGAPRIRGGLRLEGGRRTTADAGLLVSGRRCGRRRRRSGPRGRASTSPRLPRPRRSTGRSTRHAPTTRRTGTSTRPARSRRNPVTAPTRCDRSPSGRRTRSAMPDGGWLRAVTTLRESREPGVLVTVAEVRGHAPRDAGAKMVVSATRCGAPSAAATSRRWRSSTPGNCSRTAAAPT